METPSLSQRHDFSVATLVSGGVLALTRPAATEGRLRSRLQIALGLVWLLDAALQYQPFMFTKAFATQIIEPAATGNPAVVKDPLTWAARLIAEHVTFYNSIFATIQLAIAVGILVPRTRRPAMGLSILYGTSLWWMGEGLGGIFSNASPLSGVPGGVILYVLAALLLWPARSEPAPNIQVAPAERGLLSVRVARGLWAVLWASFTYYFLVGSNRSPNAWAQIFDSAASGEPGWIKWVEQSAASLAGHRGAELSIGFAVLSALIAVSVLSNRWVKPALVAASVLAIVIWVAEAFGGIFTGQGTDPNTGPLLVLLAACFWPVVIPPHADSDHRTARWRS